MGRHFLTLPGEIRNLIYDYALAYETGLIGILEPSAPQPIITFWDQERRNAANMLKYVCRQLRQETTALRVRYNLITFEGQIRRRDLFQENAQVLRIPAMDFIFPTRIEFSALQQLEKYILMCEQNKEEYPRKIEVQQYRSEIGASKWFATSWASILVGLQYPWLHNFCSKYPLVKIVIRTHSIAPLRHTTIRACCARLLAIRGVKTSLKLRSSEEFLVNRNADVLHRQLSLYLLSMGKVESDILSNVTFSPAMDIEVVADQLCMREELLEATSVSRADTQGFTGQWEIVRQMLNEGV